MKEGTMRNLLRSGRHLPAAAAMVLCVTMTATVALAQTASAQTSHSSGLAAAKKALAPYTGHPNAFPVTQKLDKKPPAGTTIAFLECGAPVCAEFASLLKPPTEALGAKLSVISAGLFPSTVQSAAQAALAQHPSAVIVAGTTLSEFGGTLQALEQAGIPVFGIGVTGGQSYGLTAVSGGQAGDVLAGQLMADWVLVHKGPHANVVFFNTPELSFSPYVWTALSTQLKSICPTCQATESNLSVLTFGTSAPSTVVSFLRANPNVNTAVFASDEGATGLPAALSAAGLSSVTTFGFAPTSVNLADIKSGGLSGGLGLDYNVESWETIDMIAKSLTHQKIQPSEEEGVVEVLDKANISAFDVKNGWSGYTDVPQRFKSLWP